MAATKTINTGVLDGALNVIKTGVTGLGPCNKMIACSVNGSGNSPATFTEANATYALASVAMAGTDFALAAGDTSGRKVTVGAKTGVSVTASGTFACVALVDTVNSVLLYVTTGTGQALTSGNTVDFPAWKIEIANPT